VGVLDYELEPYVQVVPPIAAVTQNGAAVPSLLSFKCNNVGTNATGDFEVKLADLTGNRLTTFSDGDEIRIYLRNASDASTTLVFGGIIDFIGYELGTKAVLVLKGKDWSGKFARRVYDADLADQEISITLKAILAQFADIDTTNVSTTTFSPTRVTFQGTNSLSAIQRLVSMVDWRFWISPDKKAYFGPEISFGTTTDVLVHGTTSGNVISINKDQDSTELFNKVSVYGQPASAYATAEDAVSQALYGVREVHVLNDAVQTPADAQTVADAVLAAYKDPRTVYTIKSMLLLDVSLGDQIATTAPRLGLNSTLLEVQEVGYEYGQNGIYTNLTLAEKRPLIPWQVSQLIKQTSAIQTIGAYDSVYTSFPELARGQTIVTTRASYTHTGTDQANRDTFYTVPAGYNLYIHRLQVRWNYLASPTAGGSSQSGLSLNNSYNYPLFLDVRGAKFPSTASSVALPGCMLYQSNDNTSYLTTADYWSGVITNSVLQSGDTIDFKVDTSGSGNCTSTIDLWMDAHLFKTI